MQRLDLGIPPPSVTAASLLCRLPALSPTLPIREVFGLFTDNPGVESLPVVDHGVPVGVVHRQQLIERFARPYVRELFGGKPVAAFMDTKPLVVDLHTDLDDLSRTVMESGMHYMHEGFVVTEGGRYVGMGTGYDLLKTITERTQANLYRLAHYDALTGLPNRLLFLDRLQQAMAQAHRYEHLLAVMFLDLDRFKTVNDRLGHAVGDRLLKGVSERLVRCVREEDTVARLGGDEFTVLLPELRYAQDAATVGQKILDELVRPFVFEERDVRVGASVGIVLHLLDEDLDTLLHRADVAMYHAKIRGGNVYRFFCAEMDVAGPEQPPGTLA